MSDENEATQLPSNLLDTKVSQNDVIDMMVQDNIDVLEIEYHTLFGELNELRKREPKKVDVTKIVTTNLLVKYDSEIEALTKVYGKGVKPHVVFHASNGNLFNSVGSETSGNNKVTYYATILFIKKGVKKKLQYSLSQSLPLVEGLLKVGEVKVLDLPEVKAYNKEREAYLKEYDVLDKQVVGVQQEIRETHNNKNKFKAKLTRSILEGSEEGKKLIGNIEQLMGNATKGLNEKN